MHCFYHRDTHAVGACKSCGRGICGDCAVEYAEGLACRGRCEQAVTELIELIARNRRAVVGSGRLVYMFPIFFIAVGTVFAGAGAMTPRVSAFALFMGGAFVVLGVVQALWIRRLQRNQ
jgi:positive regulator of sigma E activity